MDNQAFLTVITASFKKFLTTGSRSNEKLKILHGAIATDLAQRLGQQYQINSLGFTTSKEANIQGRYINKKVDITILKDKSPIAGIGVKFVMQNYSQNSNNYFENMLGETANIRSNSIPYFQVFIIPDMLPYYDDDKNVKHWEYFTEHNVSKYLTLSQDHVETMIHTPTKTLLYVVHIPEFSPLPSSKLEYIRMYNQTSLSIGLSSKDYGKFDGSVIYNNYEDFIDKVVHYIHFL